jgi:hypothetical protein
MARVEGLKSLLHKAVTKKPPWSEGSKSALRRRLAEPPYVLQPGALGGMRIAGL